MEVSILRLATAIGVEPLGVEDTDLTAVASFGSLTEPSAASRVVSLIDSTGPSVTPMACNSGLGQGGRLCEADQPLTASKWNTRWGFAPAALQAAGHLNLVVFSLSLTRSVV